MMLYLTGAQSSLRKSETNPQPDPSLSLGGYISSSPVPSGSLNSIFDAISSYTKENGLKETLAFGLINNSEETFTDVELRIVCNPDDEATFKVAAVVVNDEDFSMEHIANRYQEPIAADFYDATFYRAFVDLKIKNPASAGEEIYITPFNVQIEVEESGIEGTWKAFEKAFDDDSILSVKRVSKDVFRIEAKTLIECNESCEFYATEGFDCEFLGEFKNGKSNSVYLTDVIGRGNAIGIWIQRIVKPKKYKSNEQLIKDYLEKVEVPTKECVEVVISYDDNYIEK